ncbi:MAG: TIGR01777 family oxidoreductase [Gemmatimonadaceae bacterium]
MSRVVVAGASGFVGTALCAELRRQGHTVQTLGRGSGSDIVWNPATRQLEPARLEGCDAVVNLAGASIAQRWTQAAKRDILVSRVQATSLLASTMASLAAPPRVFVSISAIGFYGDAGEQAVDESSPKGSGFLSDVVQEWEAQAEPARSAGIRVVHPRLGVVLSPKGGALAKMITPFRLGAGGKIGSGKQWMSWISLTDTARALCWLIDQPSLAGAVNIVSPSPVRNEAFTDTLASVLHRPALVTVPEFAITLAFGEMGRETVLAGQQVSPRRLVENRFTFELPDLAGALRVELSKS